MAIFRINHCNFEENFDITRGDADTTHSHEWGEHDTRIHEEGWVIRYDYESTLICEIIKNNNINSILEVGSGPGVLSQQIQEKLGRDIKYHLIDKPNAKKYFEDNKFKGTFFVKDIALDLDTSGLDESYDFIICNDVLEHLLAPSNIVKQFNKLLSDNGLLFISLPNWRMAHQFIYRGLFDYDNFIYFMYIHNFEGEDIYPSILQTPEYPLLESESSLDVELKESWNFYITFKKRKV